jgi:hypothetical protein
METTGPIERIAGSVLVGVTAMVADISAVMALLVSSGVRRWVTENSIFVSWAAIALLATFIVSINRLAAATQKMRKELAHEKNRAAQLKIFNGWGYQSGW